MKKNKPIKKEKEFEVLHKQNLLLKFYLFVTRVARDIFNNVKENKFTAYGMSVYVGRQGSGKSISMVGELERIRRDFPDVKILTNFGYKNQDFALNDWQQLIDFRSESGVVFAIDEIQNEFDVYDTRNFNLEILKVVTQQRKQGIKILATSQVFSRVSKPLREQSYEVIECFTIAGRWTFQKCFDADDYNAFVDSIDPEKKFKVRRKYRRNFVQSDKIRSLYNSYEVIESMKKLVKEEKKKQTKIRAV